MTIPYSKCQAPEIFQNSGFLLDFGIFVQTFYKKLQGSGGFKVFRLRMLNLCTFYQNKETKVSNLELSPNCVPQHGDPECLLHFDMPLFSSGKGFPQKTVRNISR